VRPSFFCLGEGVENTRGESEALRPLMGAHGADKRGSSGREHPAAQQLERGSAVQLPVEPLEPRHLPLDLPLTARKGESSSDGSILSPSPCCSSLERGTAALLGSLYPPLKDLGLVLPQHRHQLLGHLVDVLEVTPCLRDDLELLALPLGELLSATDKQPRHLTRCQTLSFRCWRGRELAKRRIINERTNFPHPPAWRTRWVRMHPPEISDKSPHKGARPRKSLVPDFLVEVSALVFAFLPALENRRHEGIKFAHASLSWPRSLFRKGRCLDERAHSRSAHPQLACNGAPAQALLMEGSYLLKAHEATCPAGLAAHESRSAGRINPFFSFGVPDKRGKACILCRLRLLLCQKRFHQCGKGLSLCGGALLLLFHLPIRTFYFDVGKARSLVIEKALEVGTQVDQQMLATSRLE
jgi:hypothetical protein